MVLNRFDIIKDLIDYLEIEQAEIIYKSMRKDRYSVKDIEESSEWQFRNYSLTKQDEYGYQCENSFLLSILNEWLDMQDCTFGIQDISCGCEQIVVIFDDEVYKISNEDVGREVNQFIDNITNKKIKELFGYYYFVGEYKDCIIYSQEKAETQSYIGDKSNFFNFEEIEDDRLICGICNQLKNKELCKELNDILNNTDYIDLHEENWGFKQDGKVLIFDPLYV
jgi:hypothetical protein